MSRPYDVSSRGGKEFGNFATIREKFGDLVADKLAILLPVNQSIWLTLGQIDALDLQVKAILTRKEFAGMAPTTADQIILVPALVPVAVWLMTLQHFQKSPY